LNFSDCRKKKKFDRVEKIDRKIRGKRKRENLQQMKIPFL